MIPLNKGMINTFRAKFYLFIWPKVINDIQNELKITVSIPQRKNVMTYWLIQGSAI